MALGLTTALIAVMAGAFASNLLFSGIFRDFREQTTIALLAREMAEDVGNMKLMEHQFRRDPSPDLETLIIESFDRIDARMDAKVRTYPDDPAVAKHIPSLKELLVGFREAFGVERDRQKERDASVARMKALGPEIRQKLKSLSTVFVFDNNVAAQNGMTGAIESFILGELAMERFLLVNDQESFEEGASMIAASRASSDSKR